MNDSVCAIMICMLFMAMLYYFNPSKWTSWTRDDGLVGCYSQRSKLTESVCVEIMISSLMRPLPRRVPRLYNLFSSCWSFL